MKNAHVKGFLQERSFLQDDDKNTSLSHECSKAAPQVIVSPVSEVLDQRFLNLLTRLL